MSREAAKKFLDTMEKDLEFRSKVIKARGNKEEEHKILAKWQIGPFNQDEYKQAFKQKFNATLTGEDLRHIAAGGEHLPVWIKDVIELKAAMSFHAAN